MRPLPPFFSARALGWAPPAVLVLTFLVLANTGPPTLKLPGPHDAGLFLKWAHSLLAGEWLGEYDAWTLSKGVGFSFFLVLVHLSGLPFTLCLHLIHCASCLVLFRALRGQNWSKPLSLTGVALVLFYPLMWAPKLNGVFNDGFYTRLSFLLLVLLATLFSKRQPLCKRSAVAIGVVGAWVYLTRQEAAWLVPAVGFALVMIFKKTEEKKKFATWLGTATLIFLAPLTTVSALNYGHYGIWATSDFQHSHWRNLAGAIRRTRLPSDPDLTVSNASMRRLAEASPLFDQTFANRLRGRKSLPGNRAIWAIRGSVFAHAKPKQVDGVLSLTHRLTEDIHRACREGLPCAPQVPTLFDPLQLSAAGLALSLKAQWDWHLDFLPIHFPLSSKNLPQFYRSRDQTPFHREWAFINERWQGLGVPEWKARVWEKMRGAYAEWILPGLTFLLVFTLGLAIWGRTLPPALCCLFALGAIFRMLLIAFVDVTWFSTIHHRYVLLGNFLWICGGVACLPTLLLIWEQVKGFPKTLSPHWVRARATLRPHSANRCSNKL